MAEAGALRLLDLFAGCGGLTRGFLDTGSYRAVGAVDSDPEAAATYAVNFGEHVHLGRIEDWSLGPIPHADVVIGGPPCQGFSNLGRRDAADSRNSLWRQYVDVLRRVRPAFFLIENVPQFLRSHEYGMLEKLTRSGSPLSAWELESHVLDANRYGAAQARRRAFVVGRPRGMRPIGPPPTTGRPLVLSDVLQHVEPRVRAHELPASTATLLGRTVKGIYKMSDLHVTPQPSSVALRRYRAIPPGGGRHDLPDELKLPAWRKDFRGAGDVMGRLRWDRPAVTIRTEFFRPEKGRFLHPQEDRPLTHYEAALLQGFPSDHRWCGTKAAVARQIGNAVPVPLAAALGSHIATHFV